MYAWLSTYCWMKKGDTAECMKHMEETHKAMGL